MSWADKVHRQLRTERYVKDVMNSPELKKAREEDIQQATLRALLRFSFLGCEFLEFNHRYGKRGLLKFLDFVAKRTEEIGIKDQEYFVDAQKYYIDNHDLDIFKTLGLKLEMGDEDGQG